MPITRMMVFSPQDSFLFEISPNSFFGGSYTEELNGPHSMELITLQKLEKEQRILFEDATEKWREYVVTGVDAKHQNGERVLGQYQMVWSLQHDLQLYTIDELAGIEDPITTMSALDIVLSGTSRWTRGSVTQDALGEAEMIMKSGWECLSILLDVWGGEVDADIRVSSTNIISRRVNVLSKLGSASVTRRFDYSRDMTSIRRVVDESPIACQIIPLGKREKDIDGFDVPLTIEDVNDGKNYLRNDETAPLFRLPNGSGGWEYTEVKVDNTSIEDEEELLEWGLSVLDDYTRPKVTYEAEVLQFVAAGMDAKGVELGDTVHCIDRAFGDGEIRIEGRITSVTVDLADPSKTSIKVGELRQRAFVSMMSSITSMQSRISDLTAGVTYTTEYLNNLLDHLNDEINANGGYTYITDGQGIRTYDKAVSSPLVGYEADAVVEIKGGSIRIANSKTAQGEWEWRTVFVSGHIAADLVTAANITAGYIGNASAGSYWDLDNGILYSSAGVPLTSALDDARKVATNYLSFNTSTGLDVGYSGTNAKTRIKGNGVEIFDSAGNSALFAGVESSKSIVRVGRASGSGNVVISSDGYVDVRNASTVMAHFGWGTVNIFGSTTTGAYFSLGTRKSGYTYGKESFAAGDNNVASGYVASAIGSDNEVTGRWSSAIGRSNKVKSNYASVALGYGNEINSNGVDILAGYKLTSGTSSQSNESRFICGTYNSFNSDDVFEVGWGTESMGIRETVMSVTTGGNVKCYRVIQSSDRRVKTPLGEIDKDEASEFIRSLKPSKFIIHDMESMGFYAQDVEDTIYGDVLVSESNNCGLEDFKSLDYTAIIAPLVAYTQQLERRIESQQRQIDQQQETIESLAKRLDKLESKQSR